jgi:outer membrane protein
VRPLVAILLLAVLVTAAPAQLARDYTGVLSYNIGMPTGDLNDFISNTSFRGFEVEGRRFIRPDLSWSLSWQWNTFNEATSGTFRIPNGHITGNQHRVLYSWPFLAKAHYYFTEPTISNKNAVPYVGLGAGAYWIRETLEFGIVAVEETSWHFGFSPEAGVLIPTVGANDIVMSAGYHYAFRSGDSGPHSYWTVKLGIAYSS